MYKKITASLMAALMTLVTIVSPVLAATNLKDFPTFLLTADKALDAYVVVGSAAKTSDVVGAVDLAVALAQAAKKSETKTTTGTTQAVDGTERKILIPDASTDGIVGGSGANQLPIHLYTYHYSGLKEGQYEYKGTKHNYKEAVVLGSSTPQMTHKLGDPVNGTLKMKVDSNGVTYKYQFIDSISISDFAATAATSGTYQNPIKVTLAGKELQIVAVPTTASFRALAGSVGWIEQGSKGLTIGDLSIEVTTVYSGTQAAIKVVDKDGNLVKDLGVVDTTTQSFTYGGSTYNVKILNTATVSVAGAGNNRAQIAFAKGDVDKLFDGSDTATLSDWGTDWKISGQFGNASAITANDNITVTYSPSALTEIQKHYAAGSIFYGPGKYFELAYVGYEPNKFAQITIQPVTGKTVYNTTTATGYSTKSSLNGLEISSDVSGTIVERGTGYDKAYILFNETPTAGSFANTNIWTGYWDKTTSRIVQFNATISAQGTLASNFNLTAPIDFTLSYGGPGATVTYTLRTIVNATATWFIHDMDVLNSTGQSEVDMNFNNKSVSTASGSIELILGTGSSTADASDVAAQVEGTQQDVSGQIGNLITDGGVQAYSVKSNAEGNKVILGIPPETVYGKVQFGKTSAATAGTTYTTDTVVARTTAVAKLDTEVTATEKASNLVLVGGPCANTLTATLAAKSDTDALKTCATWPGENFALIMAFDDGFTTGKVAIVVAGTRAEDTRLGTSALQQYNLAPVKDKLTGTAVKITGTAVSTATIAAA